jgi:hypothetical protein
MSKQTAVDSIIAKLNNVKPTEFCSIETIKEWCEQAKAIEKKQLFLASNTSAKESYRAGQETMWCGCYKIADQTTYEEWLYEQFKSEEE